MGHDTGQGMGHATGQSHRRRRGRGHRRDGMVALAMSALALTLAAGGTGTARADDDPDRNWASVDVSTGFVENILGCTTAVCGDSDSLFRQSYESRGLMLLDLTTMDLVQQPGPGWWYVDSQFIRDSFERNVTARARILGVELTWSTGGLGTDSHDVTYTIDVQPTGQRFEISSSSLLIDPLDAGVLHTFTVTATRPDGTTVRGPVVTATPQADPDPDCTDHSVARECRAATNWAVVHPSTGMVENAIVCTPWQCGPDGAWGGRMPNDTPWPGHLLIELTGSAGIGWRYVDGTFVDVRPVETDLDQPSATRGSGDDAEGTDSEGDSADPDEDADAAADRAEQDADERTSTGDANSDTRGDAEGTDSEGDSADPDEDADAAADRAEQDADERTSTGDANSDTRGDAATGPEPSTGPEEVVITTASAEEPERGPLQRIGAAVAGLLRAGLDGLRSLFGR